MAKCRGLEGSEREAAGEVGKSQVFVHQGWYLRNGMFGRWMGRERS